MTKEKKKTLFCVKFFMIPITLKPLSYPVLAGLLRTFFFIVCQNLLIQFKKTIIYSFNLNKHFHYIIVSFCPNFVQFQKKIYIHAYPWDLKNRLLAKKRGHLLDPFHSCIGNNWGPTYTYWKAVHTSQNCWKSIFSLSLWVSNYENIKK